MQRPPITDSEILERELALSIVKGVPPQLEQTSCSLRAGGISTRTTLYSAWQLGQQNFIASDMKGVYRLSLMRKPCFKKPSNSLANNAFSYRADSDGDTPWHGKRCGWSAP